MFGLSIVSTRPRSDSHGVGHGGCDGCDGYVVEVTVEVAMLVVIVVVMCSTTYRSKKVCVRSFEGSANRCCAWRCLLVGMVRPP